MHCFYYTCEYILQKERFPGFLFCRAFACLLACFYLFLLVFACFK